MARQGRTAPESLSYRRRSRQPLLREDVLHLLSEWWIEVVIALLAGIGILLLFDQVRIRVTLQAWLNQAVGVASTLGADLRRWLEAIAGEASLSDLIGVALLCSAAGCVIWRTRRRLMSLPRFTTRACPRCGGELHRVHRHWLDRAVSLFVPLRRFRCRDHDCGWEGVRVRAAR